MGDWLSRYTDGLWLSSGDHPKFDYVDFDPDVGVPDDKVSGRVYWDEDNHTLSVDMNDHVSLQIGQEMHLWAVNKSGSTALNGTVVTITGSQGMRPKFGFSNSADIESTEKTIGMVTEDILNNDEGYVAVHGSVRDLDTSDWVEGTFLYLDPSNPGGLTSTRPEYPNYSLEVGIVTTSHINKGVILLTLRRCFLGGDIVQSNCDGTARDLHFITGTEKTWVNDTPTWNDLTPNPIRRSGVSAANQPDLANFRGNIQQYSFKVGDLVEDNLELLHEYKEGTSFDIHLHWSNNGSDDTDRYVKWEIEYSVANSVTTNNEFGNSIVISSEILIPADTPDRHHFRNDIGLINGSSLKIGSLIVYRLRRIASTGTAPTGNPFGLQVSCHIQQDTAGSRQEVFK